MARHKGIPRTFAEAKDRGHKKMRNVSLKAMKSAEKSAGVMLSAVGANPGDVAWVGPCIDGRRRVCYYDANMQPSDCHSEPC
jgi:hypothetical protein